MKTNVVKSKQSMNELEALKNQVLSKEDLLNVKGGGTDGTDDIIIIEEIVTG